MPSKSSKLAVIKGLDPAQDKRVQKKQYPHPITPASVRRLFGQNNQRRISAIKQGDNGNSPILGKGGKTVVDVYKAIWTYAVKRGLHAAALHTEQRGRGTITADDMREGLRSRGLPIPYMRIHKRGVKSAPVAPKD